MAISFVNAGAEDAANSGNLTLPTPSSPQVGDLWIAAVGNNADPAPGMSMTGDWTEIIDASAEAQTRIGVWWHRYTGSAPSMVVSAGGSGGGRIGGVASFRGVKASGDPINVIGSMNGGDSTTLTAPSITTTVDQCAVIFFGNQDQDPDFDLVSGFTTAFEDTDGGTQNCYNAVTSGNDTCIVCQYELGVGTGATGNKSVGSSADAHWSAIMIALEPDVGGGAQAVVWVQDD